MYGEVTHVTEENDVAVLTFSVLTDGADCVFVNLRLGALPTVLWLEVSLLLEPIHHKLKRVRTDLRGTFPLPHTIHQLQPRRVLTSPQQQRENTSIIIINYDYYKCSYLSIIILLKNQNTN